MGFRLCQHCHHHPHQQQGASFQLRGCRVPPDLSRKLFHKIPGTAIRAPIIRVIIDSSAYGQGQGRPYWFGRDMTWGGPFNLGGTVVHQQKSPPPIYHCKTDLQQNKAIWEATKIRVRTAHHQPQEIMEESTGYLVGTEPWEDSYLGGTRPGSSKASLPMYSNILHQTKFIFQSILHNW